MELSTSPPGLLPTVLLLAGGAVAAVAARRRSHDAAAMAVATAAVAALLGFVAAASGPHEATWTPWLGAAAPSPLPPAGSLLGLPLAGAAVLGLVALACSRALAGSAGLGGVLAAACLSTGGAVGALTTSDLTLSYAFAVLASAALWIGALVDRQVGPAGIRAAGRYALTAAVADLSLIAAPLVAAERTDLAALALAVGGAARLLLFPLTFQMVEAARLPGRLSLLISVNGVLLGVGWLGRAQVLAPAERGWLIAAGLATAVVGSYLILRPARYRTGLDLTLLVEAGHIAVAFGVGTPVALAGGLLAALNGALARSTLLGVADAASRRGRQERRLPEGIGLVPFGLGFGALSAMPPLPGFVARWLIYLALFDVAGAWPIALVLAICSAAALAGLLGAVSRLVPPQQSTSSPRELLVGLAPAWVPLGLVFVAPTVVLRELIGPAIAAALPGRPLSLTVEVLLGLAGVAGLVLAVVAVVGGFAGYLRALPAAWVRALPITVRPESSALRRFVDALVVRGAPIAVFGTIGEIVGQGLQSLLAFGEGRYFVVAFGAAAGAFLLVALG